MVSHQGELTVELRKETLNFVWLNFNDERFGAVLTLRTNHQIICGTLNNLYFERAVPKVAHSPIKLVFSHDLSYFTLTTICRPRA